MNFSLTSLIKSQVITSIVVSNSQSMRRSRVFFLERKLSRVNEMMGYVRVAPETLDERCDWMSGRYPGQLSCRGTASWMDWM
jgi:hypothetical protein